jgi:hypothetical protein
MVHGHDPAEGKGGLEDVGVSPNETADGAPSGLTAIHGEKVAELFQSDDGGL